MYSTCTCGYDKCRSNVDRLKFKFNQRLHSNRTDLRRPEEPVPSDPEPLSPSGLGLALLLDVPEEGALLFVFC